MRQWIVSAIVAIGLAAAAVVLQQPNVPIQCGWWTWPFC